MSTANKTIVRLTDQDILSWMQCSLSYAHGYNSELILGRKKERFALEKALAEGTDIDEPLKRIVSNVRDTVQWWYQTQLFALLGSNTIYTAPPAPDPQEPAGFARWRRFGPRNKGVVSVHLKSYEIRIKFVIPYLHTNGKRTMYEGVFFDTRYENRLDEDWYTLVQLFRIRQRLFYLATGKYLFTRYVNFATMTERAIDAGPLKLDWILTLMSLTDVAKFAQPGPHCHRTHRGSYLCKARENNQCPIW